MILFIFKFYPLEHFIIHKILQVIVSEVHKCLIEKKTSLILNNYRFTVSCKDNIEILVCPSSSFPYWLHDIQL